MPSRFDAGLAHMASRLKEVVGVAATYKRGANQVTLTAVPGKSLLRFDSGYGQTKVSWTDADFMIARADLTLGGIQVEPAKGDIIETGGAKYEVMAPGGEPAWRWSDSSRVFYRVHAKKVG